MVVVVQADMVADVAVVVEDMVADEVVASVAVSVSVAGVVVAVADKLSKLLSFPIIVLNSVMFLHPVVLLQLPSKLVVSVSETEFSCVEIQNKNSDHQFSQRCSSQPSFPKCFK